MNEAATLQMRLRLLLLPVSQGQGQGLSSRPTSSQGQSQCLSQGQGIGQEGQRSPTFSTYASRTLDKDDLDDSQRMISSNNIEHDHKKAHTNKLNIDVNSITDVRDKHTVSTDVRDKNTVSTTFIDFSGPASREKTVRITYDENDKKNIANKIMRNEITAQSIRSRELLLMINDILEVRTVRTFNMFFMLGKIYRGQFHKSAFFGSLSLLQSQ